MPTVVYRYGCLPPVAEAQRISDQISLAHKYQNKLIELERQARREREEYLSVIEPLASILAKIADLETRIAAEIAQIKAARVEERSKAAGPTEPLKALRAELKPLWKERKEALKTILAQTEVKSSLEAINEKRKEAFRQARAVCGVYWGNYLMAEAAVEQARKSVTTPNFQSWTGDGAVGTQLIHGLPSADVMAGKDTRLRIDMAATPVPERGGKMLPRIFVRIGSDGRAPIFGIWPIIMHRPLPVGSSVTWVKVIRRRVGSHEHWSAHLTVNVPEVAASEKPGVDSTKALAVNLRWSKKDDITTTAADYCDSQEEGALKVDPAIGSMLKKSDDLRSIRDRQFEEVKPLVAALKALPSLPEEAKKRLEFAHAWKAQGKLAAFVIWWRSNRFAGDESLFAKLEEWRKQDKHLWDWEANARRKALARRRDAYRVFAAQSARKYHVLVIEKLQIDKLAAKPEEHEDREFNQKASAQRFLTAPSELRGALLNAFKREGRQIFEIKAGMSSKEMLEFFRTQGGDSLIKPVAPSKRSLNFRAGKAKKTAA